MKNLKIHCTVCLFILSTISLIAQVAKPPEPDISDGLIYNQTDQLNCKDITMSLDEHGQATLNAWDILNDQPAPIIYSYLATDQNIFTCNHLGDNFVTLKSIDQNGAESTCISKVSIIDNHAPTAFCERIYLELDENGYASVSPEELVNVYERNCEVTTRIHQTEFSKNEIGENDVLVQLINKAGNISSCVASVMIEEYFPFTPTSVYLPPMIDESSQPQLLETNVSDYSLEKLTVYPNPASSEIYVVLLNSLSYADKHVEIKLIDQYGATKYSESIFMSKNYINIKDLANLTPGIYIVYLKVDDEIITKQIAIE